VFVGRSFHPEDEPIWTHFRSILDSLQGVGLTFDDAKRPTLIPVSQKVMKGIQDNDVYLGILSRRLPIHTESKKTRMKRILAAFQSPLEPQLWSVSPWVVQESGYAIGIGRKVLLLIAMGVDFPTADLHADTEWISFDRDRLHECQTQLINMLTAEIGGTLPPPTTIIEANSAPPTTADRDSEHVEQEPDYSDIQKMLRHRRSRRCQSAARRVGWSRRMRANGLDPSCCGGDSDRITDTGPDAPARRWR